MLLDLAWRLARPVLFRLDAERAHNLVISSLGRAPGLASGVLGPLTHGPRLPVSIGPLRFPGPVGLAAGLDKDADALAVWPSLGFGFVEVGTVTAHPQPGNPPPRLFRLIDERALVNRMGFNNAGSAALAQRLTALREAGRWPTVPVGANIGKSKVTPLDDAPSDYLESVERLNGLVDWFTVNVSSPNTPGLRELQEERPLRALLEAVVPAAAPTPVMLKLAPDLEPEALRTAVRVARDSGCVAVIATNTTRSRPLTTGRLEEEGGMSGRPLWPLAQSRILQALEAADGQLPIIGVGGIYTSEQVALLMDAGCAAVQVYTALIFEGPGLISRLNQGLEGR